MMRFEEQMAANLLRWEDDIAKIEVRAGSVAPRLQIEFERQLDLLFAKKQLAREKLQQFRDATSELERDEIKASLDGICNEIENSIDSAWAKLGN